MNCLQLLEAKECLANKTITAYELLKLFVWLKSPQGFDYWSDQCDQLDEGCTPSDEFWLELEKVIKQAEREEKT